MIFKSACFYREDDKAEILAVLETMCRKFMHQRGEIAFGHLL